MESEKRVSIRIVGSFEPNLKQKVLHKIAAAGNLSEPLKISASGCVVSVLALV